MWKTRRHPDIPLPHQTSSVPVRDSDLSGSVDQCDVDMSELVPVRGKKELDLKDPFWQTKRGNILVPEGYPKELESLVEDTIAWVLVPPERSRLLRWSVPDRILQPRPVLTLTTMDDGTQEVKCRCTLHRFRDPDVLDLVRDRQTEKETFWIW